MRRNRLGASAVEVTELGFGASCLGNLYRPVSDVDAEGAVLEAWRQGVRYFDTAPHYGLGLAERRLGAALDKHADTSFTLSTKVGRLLVANTRTEGDDMAHRFAVPATHHRVWDFSAAGVRASLDSSLERTGLERIDLALVHDPDDHYELALREAIPELLRLREEGRIGAVGVGMNQWQMLTRFVNTGIDAVMVAGRYTLLDQSAGRELLPLCLNHGVSVLAAAVFNSGMLATSDPAAAPTFDYRRADAELIERARRIGAVCAEHGVTLPQAALRFPLRHPAVASVVVGPRSASEMRANAESLRAPVPTELWERLRAERLLAVEGEE
jgi:D-threo-aldose 1-dehydrogenase